MYFEGKENHPFKPTCGQLVVICVYLVFKMNCGKGVRSGNQHKQKLLQLEEKLDKHKMGM